MMVKGELLRLLKDAAGALNAAKVPYAIGGAVAMALHGARRETLDVDIFATEKARSKVLTALRRAGYEVEPMMEPFLYAAWPPWKTSSREVRIDLRFPSAEPEISGVETAQQVDVGPGLRVRVFSPLMLVLSRLYSDQVKHLADISILYHRGLVPVDEILTLLQSYDRPMALRFRKIIRDIEKPPKMPRPPRGFANGKIGR